MVYFFSLVAISALAKCANVLRYGFSQPKHLFYCARVAERTCTIICDKFMWHAYTIKNMTVLCTMYARRICIVLSGKQIRLCHRHQRQSNASSSEIGFTSSSTFFGSDGMNTIALDEIFRFQIDDIHA